MAKAAERYRETYNGVKIDLTAPTDKLLQKKVQQYKAKIDAGLDVRSASPTVETWGKQWLEIYKKPKVAPKNYKNQDTICRLYIYPAIGKLRMSQITNIMLQQIVNAQAGKSKSQGSHVRSVLTDMFGKAVINRIIPYNPAAGLLLPDDLTEGTHRPLNDAEREAFLRLADKHYFGQYLLVMYYCGMRRQK